MIFRTLLFKNRGVRCHGCHESPIYTHPMTPDRGGCHGPAIRRYKEINIFIPTMTPMTPILQTLNVKPHFLILSFSSVLSRQGGSRGIKKAALPLAR